MHVFSEPKPSLTSARRARRSSLSGWLTALVAAGALAGCSGDSAESRTAPPPRDKPVVTMHPTVDSVEDTFLEREATLMPVADATISTKQDGFVLDVVPEVGDVLHTGDVIAELDRTDRGLQIRELRASVEKAVTNLANEERTWERILELHSNQVASDERRDEQKAQVELARAELEEARARLARQEVWFKDLTIVAPMPGVIAELDAEDGEYIERGSPIARLKRIDTIVALCTVNERYLDAVREGSPTVVHVTAHPDRTFEGLVWKIIGDALIESRSFPVKVVIPNPDLVLKPGMSARIAFRRSVKDAVLIPKDAVIGAGDSPVVYVVAEGIARERPVELGAAIGDRWHVRSGVERNDAVVVQGNEDLRGGDAVRLVELPPPGPPSLPSALEAERAGAAGS